MAENDQISLYQSQTIAQQHSATVECQLINRPIVVTYRNDGVDVICFCNKGGFCTQAQTDCYILRSHDRGTAAEVRAAAARNEAPGSPLLQPDLAKAQNEQEFEKQLTDARRYHDSLLLKALEISEDDEDAKAQLNKVRRSALEDYLNVVNAGCEKYLSNRFNQTAFEEMYKDAFIELLSDEEIAALVDSLTTKYRHFQLAVQKWRKTSHDI
jgi:hypothetical protein